MQGGECSARGQTSVTCFSFVRPSFHELVSELKRIRAYESGAARPLPELDPQWGSKVMEPTQR